ncbi:hypothetical protein HYG81_00695 [Natrinema zhouii]|uniref:DUF4868 domain-containing protein n=1 Tax=Natrinema zhouii TaxID=1710539 RepID=A0A7D6CNT2_9EURY|nr:hypothetical protein [Natrinema zhouii]QLK26177.1 hypothetical protein HYG81_00695 [Natrinema zhouii]
MSQQSFQEQNPLLKESQYSGKIFWLNRPTGYTLSLEKLCDQMNGQDFYDDISSEIDRENTFVPEVFEKNNRIVRTTSIDKARIAKTDEAKILIGSITLDDVSKVKYRDQNILVLGTTEADFLVFEFDSHYYFTVLSRRETSESVATILQREYDKFGSMVNPTSFPSGSIERIRESLDAQLRDTTISDYPEETISRIQITGQDLEDEEEFKRQRRRGKIKTHMIQTDILTPDDNAKTISISRDGLVRVYSNASIGTYVNLLTNHILPNIRRKVESSPSVNVYQGTDDAESIFTDINTEED